MLDLNLRTTKSGALNFRGVSCTYIVAEGERVIKVQVLATLNKQGYLAAKVKN